jgi:flagellar FliL protein
MLVAAERVMSDEPAPVPLTNSAEPAAAKSSKAVLGLLVLNLGATCFVVFKLLTAHPAEAAAPHPPTVAAGSSAEVTGPIVALDPFVVNLDEPGTSRYLKITLQLELLPEAELVITKSKELIRDAILSYLSGLHVKDTLGADAKDKIRQDLMAKVSKLLGPEKVRRMFFQDFVVQ